MEKWFSLQSLFVEKIHWSDIDTSDLANNVKCAVNQFLSLGFAETLRVFNLYNWWRDRAVNIFDETRNTFIIQGVVGDIDKSGSLTVHTKRGVFKLNESGHYLRVLA